MIPMHLELTHVNSVAKLLNRFCLSPGLPAQQVITFDHGIKVLLKFVREPLQMSNNCNIVVFVEDKGNTFEIDAKVVKV